MAAGTGSRFGAAKQYEALGDRRVLDWAVRAAATVAEGIVLAVPPHRFEDTELSVDAVVAGGATRSESVRLALAAVPESADVIVVHDAARPLASPALFSAVVAAAQAAGVDAAIPGVSVTDTIKQVRDGQVVTTLERSELIAVQTPQAFRAAALRRAHARSGEATDDAALIEASGGRVVVVAGELANAKLTTVDDLAWARQHVPADSRVGIGFDVHPFSDDLERPLVLAGVVLPGERGLAGHSDADVIAHAVADALLGAAGQGDLGEHFPDDDPAWAGADSVKLLAEAVRLVKAAGWRPVNVDCAVVLEAPRLAPHKAAMQARLSEVVEADVSLRAKRAEGLGALGRGEGVACWAVALLQRDPAGPELLADA